MELSENELEEAAQDNTHTHTLNRMPSPKKVVRDHLDSSSGVREQGPLAILKCRKILATTIIVLLFLLLNLWDGGGNKKTGPLAITVRWHFKYLLESGDDQFVNVS